MSTIQKILLSKRNNTYAKTILQVITIVFLLSTAFLLKENMGSVNEVDILPLARQYVNPQWLPRDWYLNQPAGYRLLFQVIFGKLATVLGFLTTSILGRVVCYCLFSVGFVFVGKQLGLNFLLMLIALILYLYVDPTKGLDFYHYKNQGLITYEWMVGALEAKAIAYGLVLIGLGWILKERFKLMALCFGLATSFHVLVGGWSFVSAFLLLLLSKQLKGMGQTAILISLYTVSSAFAVLPVLQHVLSVSPTFDIEASYIYVFLRLPHHLNPLSWRADWWKIYLLYLMFLGGSIAILWWQHRRQHGDQDIANAVYKARLTLAKFVLITLVPFLMGIVIAPFDSQGKILQYYPFRLGDVMLPLGTYLLSVCTLQYWLNAKLGRALALLSLLLMGWIFMIQAKDFKGQLAKIQSFPSNRQEVSVSLKEMCHWINDNTPQDAVIISPPVKFTSFSWLSERATVAKYKLLPQNKAALLLWYERLGDLSGHTGKWHTTIDDISKSKIRNFLTEGYDGLAAEQIENLMTKYEASYFLANKSHPLNLPVVYQNSELILYGTPTELAQID